jgi:hypothetical protein
MQGASPAFFRSRQPRHGQDKDLAGAAKKKMKNFKENV